MPTILVASWSDGLLVIRDDSREHELAGQCLRALAPDGRGGALVVLGDYTLRRRTAAGEWSTLASFEVALSCCVVVGDRIYVGTDDARVLRLEGGVLIPLHGFNKVAGREQWYAGQAVVDGRVVGPPLGVRSISATADGALLANVHVGGIPRSTDGGATWHPTIAVDSDVHEVRGHPRRPEIVAAAAAVGLCLSRDGGATWVVESGGLHAPHASAVGFVGDDVLISTSEDPFSPQGAVYRRAVDADGPLRPGDGLPRWLDGGVDTGGIAANGEVVAVATRAGAVYVSLDAGSNWDRMLEGVASPSGVLIL
jgi:hypothetical protein